MLLFPTKSPPNGRDVSCWRGKFSITSPSNTPWRCSSHQPPLQDCWFPGSFCPNCCLHWQISRTETALISDFTRPSIHLQFSNSIPPFRDISHWFYHLYGSPLHQSFPSVYNAHRYKRKFYMTQNDSVLLSPLAFKSIINQQPEVIKEQKTIPRAWFKYINPGTFRTQPQPILSVPVQNV